MLLMKFAPILCVIALISCLIALVWWFISRLSHQRLCSRLRRAIEANRDAILLPSYTSVPYHLQQQLNLTRLTLTFELPSGYRVDWHLENNFSANETSHSLDCYNQSGSGYLAWDQDEELINELLVKFWDIFNLHLFEDHWAHSQIRNLELLLESNKSTSTGPGEI